MNIHTIRYGIKEFGVFDAVRLNFWLKAKEHGIHLNGERKISIKRTGRKVFIRPTSSDILVLANIFCMDFDDGSREYDIDFTKKGLQDVQYIIDAGANFGIFSVLYASLYPKAEIIAIEPEKENFNLLCKNIKSLPNVHPVEAGLWNKDVNLRVIARDSGAWGFTVEECENNGEGLAKAVSISSLCEQFRFPYVDILKMDIEGSEYEVFSENSEKWINCVKCIIIEIHDDIKPGCNDIVNNTMYTYGFTLESNGENEVWYKNF